MILTLVLYTRHTGLANTNHDEFTRHTKTKNMQTC
jgi:hypothetical protein